MIKQKLAQDKLNSSIINKFKKNVTAFLMTKFNRSVLTKYIHIYYNLK